MFGISASRFGAGWARPFTPVRFAGENEKQELYDKLLGYSAGQDDYRPSRCFEDGDPALAENPPEDDFSAHLAEFGDVYDPGDGYYPAPWVVEGDPDVNPADYINMWRDDVDESAPDPATRTQDPKNSDV